ncbi:helix-turn-helix domain-containing protein [Actinomadura sp. SCN-SB]|uniref:helix-turn-helix domain-containing protein n=1 Tax=Actinomadura sp. SCN-SB TaxID=3373092 RepID=UPI003750EE8E
MEVSDRLLDIPDGVTPAMVATLRGQVPEIVQEAVAEIERGVPWYARPHDPRYSRVLEQAVERAVAHFADLLADPDASSAETMEFFRRLGADEAREGRDLDPLRAALRTGAGVAVRRLTEASERTRHRVTATMIAQVARSVLAYLDRLAAVVAEGHAEGQAEVAARGAGEYDDGRRRALLDLLLSEPPPRPAQLGEPARRAGWPLPRAVAAVALRERRPGARPPSPPGDVLTGMHLDEPCLIVPDPDDPGRRRALRDGLSDWVAAIGPSVAPAESGRSLRWARQTLDLATGGVIAHDGLVATTDHTPILLMTQDRDLLERAVSGRLRPLLKLRPAQRRRLAETFLVALECGFNTVQVSSRLRVHPQTIRYRVRQLETFFGEDIYAPGHRLEFHMLLHAWLAMNREPGGANGE